MDAGLLDVDPMKLVNKFTDDIQKILKEQRMKHANEVYDEDLDNNPRWQMLKKILLHIHIDNNTEDGNKSKALCDSVVGTIMGANVGLYPDEDLINLCYNWWNTNKNGKKWKHKELEHYPDHLISEFYGTESEKARKYNRTRSEFSSFDALMLKVPDTWSGKKDLIKELKQFKKNNADPELTLYEDELPEVDTNAVDEHAEVIMVNESEIKPEAKPKKQHVNNTEEKHDEKNTKDEPENEPETKIEDVDTNELPALVSDDNEEEDEEEDEEEIDDIPEDKPEEELKETVVKGKKVIDTHDFKTIEYIKENTIRKAKESKEKIMLLLRCCRYVKARGVFVYWMDCPYEMFEIKYTAFKCNILPAILPKQCVDDAYYKIMYNCSIEGRKYNNGFSVRDLYKDHPLEYVTDTHGKTYDRDKKLFNEFLLNIICNNHQKCYNYLLKWIAAYVQSPGKYEQAIIIISGQHGTGKTLLCKLLAFLLYYDPTVNFNDCNDQFMNCDYSSYSDTLADYTTKFNSKTSKRIFTGIQELGDADESVYKIIDMLKRLTDPVKGLEKKGYDSTNVQNISSILIASNSVRCLPIEETERRYVAIQTNTSVAKNKKIFKKYYNGFSKPYFVKHIYDYLRDEVDLDDYVTLEKPVTELYLNMVVSSMTSLTKFVFKHHDKCVEGISYTEFCKLVQEDSEILGKYKNINNLWTDYNSKYNCSETRVKRTRENGSVYTAKVMKPSEAAMNSVSYLYKHWLKLFPKDDADDDSAIDLGNDLEEKTKLIVENLQGSVKVKYNKSGDKVLHYYILNNEIDSKFESLTKEILVNNGWKEDNHLTDKRNQRGFKSTTIAPFAEPKTEE